MRIALVGLPGSGKSTVGRLLAERMGLPFVDLDEAVTAKTGRSPADWIEREGEGAFRRVEAEVLRTCLGQGDLVLAAGGGAVTGPEATALTLARTLWLDVPVAEAATRVGDGSGRPLLAGDVATRLAALAAERRPLYRRVSERAFDGRQAPADVVAAMVRHLEAVERVTETVLMGPIKADLEAYSPPPEGVVVAAGRLRALHPELPAGPSVDDREEAKRLGQVEALAEALARHGLDRGAELVAVGGGVTTDLVGLTAAVFLRGVSWLAVPTSLLGMVDAALGGKTGVDLAAGKNLVGAFHPPRRVLIDPSFLDTLPARERQNGFAELVKYAVLAGGDLPALVAAAARDASALSEAIRRAVRLKEAITARDPREQGERALLNLGHTLAHGLEAASGYRLPHGQAVAIGLAAIGRFAAAHGGFPELPRLLALLAEVGLPTAAGDVDREACLTAMRLDKKRRGEGIVLAVPRAFGDVRLERHPLSALDELVAYA